MSRRGSARVAQLDKEEKEGSRDVYTEVERKFKRTRLKHLEQLESSNFGMHRGAADQVIAATGGGLEDAAAEVVGKKAKKTRTGRQHDAMSKKPLGQILYESNFDDFPAWVPTYMNTATRMPNHPPRQFCAICGGPAPYTCSHCGVRYCRGRCYGTHCETRCIRWN